MQAIVKKIIQRNVCPPSTEMFRCPSISWSFPKVSEGLEQADQTLPLLNLLLDLITGGGNLSLCRQNSTQEGRQRSSNCCVEGPAEWTQSWPKGQGFGAAVADHLLWTPTGRVQHEAHHQQQAWRESRRWDEGFSHVDVNIGAESTNRSQRSWERGDSALEKNTSIFQLTSIWFVMREKTTFDRPYGDVTQW